MHSPFSQGPILSPSVYSEQPAQAEQPARRHRPLSSFFRGSSVLGRNHDARLSNISSTSTPRMPAPLAPHARVELEPPSSPSSMLSMRVGPTAPPSFGSRTHSMASFNGGGLRGLALPARAQVLDYGGHVPFAADAEPQLPRDESPTGKTTTSHRRRRRHHEPRWVPKHAEGKVWFPALSPLKARKKFFHAAVTGTLLAIILIVCSSTPIGSDHRASGP